MSPHSPLTPSQAHRARASQLFQCFLESRIAWAVLLLLFLTLYCVSIFTQPLGDDEGYFLYCADRLLHHDPMVFVFNFPLMYYFDAPAVAAAHFLGCSEVLSLNIYLVSLVLLSLWICGLLMDRLLWPESLLARRGILLFLAIILLVYPIHGSMRNDFGEREHILMIAAAPYLFLAAARAAGREIDWLYAGLIGCFAGVGMTLKPVFLPLWLLMEAYLVLGRRVGPSWRRPEAIVIGLITLLHFAAIEIWFPDFLKSIRWTMQTYNIAYGSSPLSILQAAMIPLEAILFLLLVRPRSSHHELPRAVGVGVFCLLLSAYLQHNDWFYHFYPAYSASLLLLYLLTLDSAGSRRGQASVGPAAQDTPTTDTLPHPYSLTPSHLPTPSLPAPSHLHTPTGFSLALLAAAGTLLWLSTSHEVEAPWFVPLQSTVFIPLALMLLWPMIDLAESKGILQHPAASMIRRLPGFGLLGIAAAATLRGLLGQEDPSLEITLLPALFGLTFFRAAHDRGALSRAALSIASAGAWLGLLSVLALNALHSVQAMQASRDNSLSKLEQVIRRYAPHREIYVFSTAPDPTFPLVNYTGAHLGPHFSCLSYLPALYTQAPSSASSFPYRRRSEMGEMERFVVDGVISDMARHPDLVILGGRYNKHGFTSSRFDYLEYFSHDPRFRRLWKHYHLLTSFDTYQVYSRQ